MKQRIYILIFALCIGAAASYVQAVSVTPNAYPAIPASGGTGYMVGVLPLSIDPSSPYFYENWTVSTTDTWITSINPSAGLAIGNFTFAVSANTGTATRTGTIKVTGDFGTAEVTITQEAAPYVPVTGVTISRSATSSSMLVGETETVHSYLTPSNATNKTVQYSSSNQNVVKIYEGSVWPWDEIDIEAKSAGTATIKVTTEDGNHTASFIVTVSAVIPVTGVTISRSAISSRRNGNPAVILNSLKCDIPNRTI